MGETTRAYAEVEETEALFRQERGRRDALQREVYQRTIALQQLESDLREKRARFITLRERDLAAKAKDYLETFDREEE